MMISFQQLISLFQASLGGIATALVISPLAIWIATRTKLLDIPGSALHKQHAKPTPLAGGIVVALSAVVLMMVFRLWYKPYSTLLAAAGIIFAFGLWDDAKGLSALQKLIGQVLASVLLVVSDVSVKFISNVSIPFLSQGVASLLNSAITVFWLVGIANAVNLVDSMDGLAVGIVSIAFAFFMGMALVSEQIALALFSAAFLGICIGLYIFNVSPPKLFLGDSGAQTLGFVLAGVAMIYAPDNLPQGSSWFVPIMVLGVPIFDTTLVVVTRLLRHKPVFRADCAHTYHRLVTMGLDPNRAVITIHLMTLILNFLAFIALSLSPWKASIIFGAVVVAGLALMIFLGRINPEPD